MPPWLGRGKYTTGTKDDVWRPAATGAGGLGGVARSEFVAVGGHLRSLSTTLVTVSKFTVINVKTKRAGRISDALLAPLAPTPAPIPWLLEAGDNSLLIWLSLRIPLPMSELAGPGARGPRY